MIQEANLWYVGLMEAKGFLKHNGLKMRRSLRSEHAGHGGRVHEDS